MIERMTPAGFTAEIFRLVREESAKVASEWLDEYVSAGHIESTNYRVHQALKQIEDAEALIASLNAASDQSGGELVVKKGRPALLNSRHGIPTVLDSATPEGTYCSSRISLRKSDDFNVSYLSPEAMELFRKNDFFQLPPERVNDRLFVAKGVRLSEVGGSAANLVSNDGTFYPTRSGRNARLTGRCLVNQRTEPLDVGLILPFPYAPLNYYHSLTEQAYGLRFAHLTPDDTPIVFDIDPFGQLPVLCETLGIEPSRLIRREDAVNYKFETGILPDVGPYYWSADFRTFFRSIATKSSHRQLDKKIYISRKKSQRAMAFEVEIEDLLKSMDFQVLYAEELTFAEQIEMFSQASTIVAAHGAGVSNTVFAKSDCTIVEIFQARLPVRDFQMRSRFVTSNYIPLVMDEGSPQQLLEDLKTIFR